MKTVISLLAIVVSVLLIPSNATALITIDTVPVGNAGNAYNAGYGAVGYDYGIGKAPPTETSSHHR